MPEQILLVESIDPYLVYSSYVVVGRYLATVHGKAKLRAQTIFYSSTTPDQHGERRRRVADECLPSHPR